MEFCYSSTNGPRPQTSSHNIMAPRDLFSFSSSHLRYKDLSEADWHHLPKRSREQFLPCSLTRFLVLYSMDKKPGYSQSLENPQHAV